MPYKDKAKAREQKRRWREQNPDKVKEISRRWYERNGYTKLDTRTKEQHAAKNKKARESRIQLLHEHLGDKCVNCGSKDNLEFDHIDPSLKASKTPPQAMGISTIKNELPNLQVLCHDCHKIKSNAQKHAAWWLLCQLSLDEQTELMQQFEGL